METLLTQGYFALFVIITLGMVLGKVKVFGFSFDVSAVIFVALAFGHFGYQIPPDFLKVGLLLFIFTIGIQAGPGFFDAFLKNGRNQILTTVAIIFSGALTTYLLAYALGLDMKLGVGIFNGALTSTPGLAAAIEATDNSPLAPIGYGIAYPFGVIGVIIFMNILPKIFRVDLKKEEERVLSEIQDEFPEIQNENVLIKNPNVDGKSIKELKIRSMTNSVVSRVMHDGVVTTPSDQTVLHLGDTIKIVGTDEAREKAILLLGEHSDEQLPLAKGYEIEWVLVTNKRIINKKYKQIGLSAYYDATVLRIRRSGVDITPNANSTFRFGDRVLVACKSQGMDKVMQLLGNQSKALSSTDFIPITLGVVLGILLGNINIPLGSFQFNLGITGGTLAVGLALSRIGKTGPIIWSMSGSANQLLRQFGLLLFLATIGTKAGADLVSTISTHGVKLLFIGMAVTVVPILVGAAVGRFIFKMNFLTLLGVITGGMTSTPGLGIVNSKSDTNAAPIAYATVYPAALVCVIIFSQILAHI